MTLYAESSAVLRWLFGEKGADAIGDALRAAQKVVCSRLTLIELRRVIRRAAVQGELAEAAAEDLFALVARLAATWSILELSGDVAARAEEAFPAEPVRTLDAIHLASGLVLRQSLPDLRFLSTDERVVQNARRLGFEVVPG